MAHAGEGGGEAPARSEIVFHLEVLCARGLPRPAQTLVVFSGFGIEGCRTSLPVSDASSEPRGWLFPAKEKPPPPPVEEAAVGKKDAKKGGKQSTVAAPPVETEPVPDPEPICRLAKPCRTDAEKQQVLDSVCSPLTVTVKRCGEPHLILGVASVELKRLIHDTDTVELEANLVWSKELIAELQREFDAKVAADAEAAAAAAEEAAKEASEAGEAPEATEEQEWEVPPPRFEEPAPGKLQLRVSTAGPIGRALCPEDLHDWSVVTVRVDGCYRLPAKLQEAGGPLPEGFAGVVETHPLSYNMRLFGCSFHGGQLVVPQPQPPMRESASPAASPEPVASSPGEDGDTPEGDDAAAMEGSPSPDFAIDVGEEEFLEAFLRAGYAAANEDGPVVFEFLSRPRTGMGGKIGRQEFVRLDDLAEIAEPAQLVALRAFLLEQGGGSLAGAFQALDEEGEGRLTSEAFRAGLERLGYEGADRAERLFEALDGQHLCEIAPDDLAALGLLAKLHELERAERLKDWLLASCGSVAALQKHADAAKSGKVSPEAWRACVERLGCADSMGDAEVLFRALATEARSEDVPVAAFAALTRLDVAALRRALPELAEILAGADGVDAEAAFARLRGDADVAFLAPSEFRLACEGFQLGASVEPAFLFALLDSEGVGAVGVDQVAALLKYRAVHMRRRLAAFKAFIVGAFGGAAAAFKRLFDDHSGVLQDAEETLPRVQWPTAVVRGYRGRAWLQKLLNTLRDERGRFCLGEDDEANGGTWLYFFPSLAGQQAAVDYKEVTDAAQAGLARLARWHHARAFVDLRRLAAPAATGSGGPQLEFRAFLVQAADPPADCNADGGLPAAPFGACHTFIKGVISLDRPLERLCPRGIHAPLQLGSVPLVPPPPAAKPPPTVVEELEFEARRVVGKLAGEFARMCRGQGLEEPQVAGPEGELSPHSLLGHRGVVPHRFLQWLKEEGTCYRDLAAELRPAIVRMVRNEAKDGPSCGLSGNEKDAMYSSIRDLILRHLYRALNQDVDLYRRKRDARHWRGPVLHGEADATDPNFGKPGDIASRHQERDAVLRRLAFEYELVGEHRNAIRLYSELLSLPHNAESSSTWFGYARLLMRCGQRQPEAVKALQFCVSLRSPEEGPSLHEAAFLACMLQNQALPCSDEGPEPIPGTRFEAALAMLEGYIDKHAGEQMPLYFLFVIYAVEAFGLQAEAAEASLCKDMGLAVAKEASSQLYRARAMKYLELARLTPMVFRGSLSEPRFPELDALSRRERLARGDLKPPAAERPEEPQAWAPPKKPVFCAFDERHRLPSEEDSVALQCLDLMLYFGVPAFIHFLLSEASEAYGFLTEQTVRSERCKLMSIKASMLAGDLDDAISQIESLLAGTGGCVREAHILLGECHYRKAKVMAPDKASAFAPALAAYNEALGFLKDDLTGAAPLAGKSKPDPVLHLRVASIHYLRAEVSAFADADALGKAIDHYKRSLQVVQTAEAWRCAGICAYRQACLLPSDGANSDVARKRQSHLRDALRFLTEANLLDNARPDISAWLATCSVELGLVQVAKQAVRQAMRFEEDLGARTALELASVLLRFSDERQAPSQANRGPLYLDGRYAAEAIAMARLVLKQEDMAEAHLVLGRALEIKGELKEAARELASAIEALGHFGDARGRDAALQAGRRCAARLVGEPQWTELIEQASAEAQIAPVGGDDWGAAPDADDDAAEAASDA